MYYATDYDGNVIDADDFEYQQDCYLDNPITWYLEEEEE